MPNIRYLNIEASHIGSILSWLVMAVGQIALHIVVGYHSMTTHFLPTTCDWGNNYDV